MKSGRPYIVHEKASDWQANLEREANGVRWAGELFDFFESVTFDDRHRSVQGCYVELADQVERRLAAVDPYFVRLGQAMRTWLELWEEFAGTASPADRVENR